MCNHHPDPKTFRNPVAVGSGPDDYLLRITCNCVHCGMAGELMVEAPHANIEWEEEPVEGHHAAPSLSECFPSEEPDDFDPSPTYPWGESPPRGNYPADNE